MERVQVQKEQVSLGKKQSNFIGKISLIAGGSFAIIFVISFLMNKFWLTPSTVHGNIGVIDGTTFCVAVGTISLLVALFSSLFIRLRGGKASIGAYSFLFAIFVVSFSFMFASYFSIFGQTIMFTSLGYTALALLVTGTIGYFMSDKAANMIAKISMFAITAYIIISLIGSLFFYFVYATVWYYILINVAIGLVIIGSNIFTFYQIRQMNEFSQLNELPDRDYKILVLSIALNLLLSIIQTFIYILRLVAMFARD